MRSSEQAALSEQLGSIPSGMLRKLGALGGGQKHGS